MTTYVFDGFDSQADALGDARLELTFSAHVVPSFSYQILIGIPGNLPLVEVQTNGQLRVNDRTLDLSDPYTDGDPVLLGQVDWRDEVLHETILFATFDPLGEVFMFPIAGEALLMDSGVFIDLSDTSGAFGPGQPISLENLVPTEVFEADVFEGGLSNDEFYGGAGDDSLFGLDGNDTLHGGDGADTLSGQLGNDALFGFIGNDRIEGNEGRDSVLGGAGSDTLFGGDEIDEVIGGADNDLLFGGLGNDTVLGNSGNDTLYGGNGGDDLFGGSQNDVLYSGLGADTANGGVGDDTIKGGSGRDLLIGDAGNDEIEGGAGADTLLGGDGDDLLRAGDQDDELIDGAGSDMMYGGGGADHFIVISDQSTDTIADFDVTRDRLILDALTFDGMTGQDIVDTYAMDQGADIAFDFGGGDVLIFHNIDEMDTLVSRIDLA